MLKDNEDIDALVEMWLATNEGMSLWTILEKLDRYCSNWMLGRLWFGIKKKLFVQIMQWHLNLTVGEYEEDE